MVQLLLPLSDSGESCGFGEDEVSFPLGVRGFGFWGSESVVQLLLPLSDSGESCGFGESEVLGFAEASGPSGALGLREPWASSRFCGSSLLSGFLDCSGPAGLGESSAKKSP